MSTPETATLSLALDSRPVAQGIETLERFTPAAQRAESAADALAATFTKTGAGARALGSAANENAKAVADMERRVVSLRSQLDPLAASEERVARATAEANSLFKAGAITQQEHGRLVGLAAKAHTELEMRVSRSSKAAGLSANDWRMLSFQANDAAAMLLSGSSAMQVVATQGGQVFQVLQGANGGVRGALGGIASVGGVVVGSLLAVTGALAAGAAAYNNFDASQKRTQRSLMGSGKVAGITPGDVQDIAKRSPLPDALAEQITGDLASTGRADRAGITSALGVTKDLAATMGTDFATAGKTLTDLATGGVASLDKLNERYRFLSAGQRQRIIDLENEGKGAEAFKASIDALSGGLGKYNDLTSYSTRLADALAGGFSQLKSGATEAVASLMGDPRAGSGPQALLAQRAGLTNEATALTKQLADIEAARKKTFGSPVDEATLDGLYPADRIRLRLDEIAKAQEDTSRRIALAQAAQLQAQRSAAAETLRMQTERIITVRTGLERDNDLARKNPIEQRTVQVQREAGVYKETDLASSLRRLAEPGAYQPYVQQRDRIGDRASDPIMPKGMPPPVTYRGTPDMFDDHAKADKDSYAEALQKQVLEGSRINQKKQLTEAERASTLSLQGETEALGKSAGAAETVRQKTAQRIALGQQGIEIDKDVTKQIDAQAEAYGRLVQVLAEKGLNRDILFERDQLGRSQSEAGIAARLRPVYGDDLNSKGATRAADEIRTTGDLAEAKAMVTSGATSFVSDLRRSGDAAGALANVFGSVADKFAGKAIDSLVSSAFGAATKGGLSSLWPFANGGIMSSAGPLPLHTYATGGVASTPQMALFGEGRMPEAFVPLPDGRRIPVAMQGGAANSNGGPSPTINVAGDTINVTPAEGVTPAQLSAVLARRDQDFRRNINQIVAGGWRYPKAG